MGNQTLSQDELNLLLNDVMSAQEDLPAPDGVSAATLTENDVAGFPGAAEKPPRENMGAQRPVKKKLWCSLFSSCLWILVIPKRKARSINWN